MFMTVSCHLAPITNHLFNNFIALVYVYNYLFRRLYKNMSSGSKKVIIAALIGNALISITKFSAAVFTGSSAMLSEGIHSLVDTGNQIL